MDILAKILGSSTPFDLLLAHLRKTMECVNLTKPLLDAATSDNMEEVRRIADRVFKLEHEADGIKNQIRDHLPKSMLMSVSRADFLAYLREQDGLADKVEDLAAMLSMQGFRLPAQWSNGTFRNDLLKLADYAVTTAQQASALMIRFGELRRKGFSGEVIEQLREEAMAIGRSEWQVDKQQYKLVQALLTLDDPDWPFASTYILLEIVRALGRLADHAEGMGDYIRLMIAD
ncbi:TIGR00153 family protein [bacterium]|nr:TIGR00153 family protein [bacterium]MBU1983361.1 TIGR00153 family protein [bacterium]